MSLQFHKIIAAINAEIKPEHELGAYVWIDKHHHDAHKKAVDDFDRALVAAIERHDYRSAEIAGETYKHKVIKLLREYKKNRGLDDQQSFLDSLEMERQ